MVNQRSDSILRLIALFKLAKVIALTTVGIVALRTVDHTGDLDRWAGMLRFAPSNKYLHGALAKIGGLSTRQLEELGVGTFVYAAVFLVEGLGLWRRKRWAEYLTVIVTGSFIPIEIYELVEHVSIAKAVAIAINIAVVLYLIIRIRRDHRDR